MKERIAKLLLVEDDPNLGDILQEYLNIKGYQTSLCANGALGWDKYKKETFDMCILDVMMPVMDGFTLAQKIRNEDKHIPIIFLTAKSMKEDKLKGFKIGADDYLSKPFSMEELVMRIEAILRRSQANGKENTKLLEEYQIGQYTFNPLKQELHKNGNSVKLTTKEASLLTRLCQNKNNIMERGDALKEIWGEDTYFNARSMDVFITKLRKYLKEDDKVSIINVHGKGYKLIDV